MYFQGFSLMNQLRNLYQLDTINPAIEIIQSKDFNKAYFLFSTKVEDNTHSEILNQISDMCLLDKDEDFNSEIHLKDIMIKMFLTIERKLFSSYYY